MAHSALGAWTRSMKAGRSPGRGTRVWYRWPRRSSLRSKSPPRFSSRVVYIGIGRPRSRLVRPRFRDGRLQSPRNLGWTEIICLLPLTYRVRGHRSESGRRRVGKPQGWGGVPSGLCPWGGAPKGHIPNRRAWLAVREGNAMGPPRLGGQAAPTRNHPLFRRQENRVAEFGYTWRAEVPAKEVGMNRKHIFAASLVLGLAATLTSVRAQNPASTKGEKPTMDNTVLQFTMKTNDGERSPSPTTRARSSSSSTRPANAVTRPSTRAWRISSRSTRERAWSSLPSRPTTSGPRSRAPTRRSRSSARSNTRSPSPSSPRPA